jgi:hypothetical protein
MGPHGGNSESGAESAAEISLSGAVDATLERNPPEHPCQVCPTCGCRLREQRCKLVCTQCGYFMSCADYY